MALVIHLYSSKLNVIREIRN